MKILCPRQFAVWVSTIAIVTLVNTALAETASDNTQDTLLSLSGFIASSLDIHPELLAAKADIQSARAALRASDQAVYNPELEFDYEDTDVKTRSIGISQTIDWGDQQGSRTAVAKAELLKASADYDLAMQSFVSNLLRHLSQNQTEKELAQLSNETLKLMQEFKVIAERRFQSGDLGRVELNLAQLAYSEALMKHASQQANAYQAQEQLRALLGEMPDKLPDLPEILPEPSLPQNLNAFLQTLPVMRSLLAEVQAARQTVAVRQSEKAWNPTIGLAAGTEGEESLVGINLTIPLNVRNSFSAEVDAAQQDLIAIEQRTHLAYRNLRADVLSSAERYRQLQKAWNDWQNISQHSVKQQLSLIKQLWRAGDMNTTDYLVQLKQTLETQGSGLQLRGRLWQVAFDWMVNTTSIHQWLGINLHEQDKS